MKKEKIIVNDGKHKVTMEPVPEGTLPKAWLEVVMHTAAYDRYMLELVTKSNMAVKITIFLGMCLSSSSPFIPMTQKLLAEKLKTSAGNISTAMKLLLQGDVVIKVNSETFALNPLYIFKGRFDDREFWLRVIEGEGYQEAYKASKAIETLNKLKEKYR